MNNKIYKRIIKESKLLINNNLTIRQIAKKVKVSKSTVHKDLHERLEYIDKRIFENVQNILRKHIEIRHINGGNATKIKYQKLRKGWYLAQ